MASWRIRLKIKCDCTGEPPGELTTTATLGSLEALKAFSMAPANDARESPGRNGVTMPIAPVKRRTGTIGPRLKNSIDCLAMKCHGGMAEKTKFGRTALTSRATEGEPTPICQLCRCCGRPASAAGHSRQVERCSATQDGIDFWLEAVARCVQNQAWPQLQRGAAPLDALYQHPMRRCTSAGKNGKDHEPPEACGEGEQHLIQAIGAMDHGGRTAGQRHGGHEAQPTLKTIGPHGVSRGLERRGRGRARALALVWRIGQHVVEAFSQSLQFRLLAKRPVDRSHQHPRARRQTIAHNVA